MQKKCPQKQLRNTSRMNIFVLLMTLFLVNGHCSAVYASSAIIPQPVDQQLANNELMDLVTDSDHHSGSDHHSESILDCNDVHDDSPSSAWQQLKDKQDNAKPLVAALNSLPLSQSGRCDTPVVLPFTDYITPPLFYTLCVLRL